MNGVNGVCKTLVTRRAAETPLRVPIDGFAGAVVSAERCGRVRFRTSPGPKPATHDLEAQMTPSPRPAPRQTSDAAAPTPGRTPGAR